jgi:sarcosine oxidase
LTRRYDAIVVGVGTIGSAAAYHLARRGARVLGLERYGIAHDRGSMHGLTRIIRLAYHEDPRYVALLRRAYELWRELERDSGERLLHVVGSLDVGPEDGALLTGALRACHEHGLAHELLPAAELARRFPAYDPPPGVVALLQPDGGYLDAERCVRAHADAAVAAGAELRPGERVLEWGGTTVRTDRGAYEAERIVLCPGAWAPGLLRVPGLELTVERQVVAWFSTGGAPSFRSDRFPIFIADEEGGEHYGFPDDGHGLKVGLMHHPGEVGDAETLDREVHPGETDALAGFARRWFPSAPRTLLDVGACLFTNTRDGRFVLDLHPDEPAAVVASVCSGHGFKFAPVAGEILADLALDGATRHPIDFLRLAGR